VCVCVCESVCVWCVSVSVWFACVTDFEMIHTHNKFILVHMSTNTHAHKTNKQHTHARTHTHTHKHTQTHTRTHIHKHTRKHTYTNTRTQIHLWQSFGPSDVQTSVARRRYGACLCQYRAGCVCLSLPPFPTLCL